MSKEWVLVVARAGAWFLRLSEIQFPVALGYVVLMVMVARSNTPAAAMLVANAMILTVGGTVDRFAKCRLSRSLFDPEIKQLACSAGLSDTETYHDLRWVLPPLQLSIAIMASFWPFLLKGAASTAWAWQVTIGLAISEAIYLTWVFEGVLMKAELEGIARRWTHLLAARARAEAQSSGLESAYECVPTAEALRVLAAPEPDVGWFVRARYLQQELRRHGFKNMRSRASGPGFNWDDPIGHSSTRTCSRERMFDHRHRFRAKAGARR